MSILILARRDGHESTAALLEQVEHLAESLGYEIRAVVVRREVIDTTGEAVPESRRRAS
jgi:hypothetical protein